VYNSRTQSLWPPNVPINQRSVSGRRPTAFSPARRPRPDVPLSWHVAARAAKAFRPRSNSVFPRRDRLPRALFSQSRGLRAFSPHFSAVLPVEGHGYAVVISKKTLRLSVDRHRLKRQIIGALRRPSALPLPQALILFPKASALTLDPAHLRAELSTLLKAR